MFLLLFLLLNHLCLFCVHLMLSYHPVQLSHTVQISAACSGSWYWKLEFWVTSFWFYYHQLWWSSWHAMLALFLFYVFLVWIFSWRDLFQVKRTDTSCVLYIICSQFILSSTQFSVHALFCLLRLVCCIVGITWYRFSSHLFLFVFGSI